MSRNRQTLCRAKGLGMVAEALTNELKLDHCKIDLSSILSKYIGETEKNLDR